MIEEGGADALDALAFRISGSGERVAEAFEGTARGARARHRVRLTDDVA